MRRCILFGIGLIETLLACVLLAVGFRLPRSESIDEGFQRASVVAQTAQNQVQLIRGQLGEVRHKDFPKVANHLRVQTRAVSSSLRAQAIDFDSVDATSDALGAVSQGLESWSETLDADRYLSNARELGRTAELLEWQAAWTDPRKAVCKYQTGMDTNWGPIVDLVCGSFDVRSLTIMAASLFQDLKCAPALDVNPIRDVRDSFREIEETLATAVRQVDALGEAVYPFVTPNGALPPTIEFRPVWSDGRKVGDALSKAGAAVRAIGRDLDRADRAIEMLTKQRREGRSATPTDDAGRIAAAVARTSIQLRELASDLRRTQQGIEQSLRAWPELVQTMRRSATVLEGSHRQLEVVLSQRSECERAVRNSQQLADSSEDVVRGYTAKLDVRLGDQERSLAQVEEGLREVNESLPAVSQAASDLLSVIRWMFWLIGGLIAIHGVYVAVEAKMKR
jgi:hypothetical protein